jgi:hypothetical protein
MDDLNDDPSRHIVAATPPVVGSIRSHLTLVRAGRAGPLHHRAPRPWWLRFVFT